MSQLMPMEIINTILSYHEKEYYYNKYTKQLHIRFTQKYVDSILSFQDIYCRDDSGPDNYHNTTMFRRNGKKFCFSIVIRFHLLENVMVKYDMIMRFHVADDNDLIFTKYDNFCYNHTTRRTELLFRDMCINRENRD
jgi:hypothetical protein